MAGRKSSRSVKKTPITREVTKTGERRYTYTFVLVTLACIWGLWGWLAVVIAIVAMLALWYGVRIAYVQINSLQMKLVKKLGIERTRYLLRWSSCADSVGLPGCKAVSSKTDNVGVTLRLRLHRGQSIRDVFDRLPAIESALSAIPQSARVWPEKSRADRCYLRIVTVDKLSEPIPWAGPQISSVREPVPIGIYEDEEEVRLKLVTDTSMGGHVLIGGMTGSGKSGLLSVIIGNLAVCDDAVLWGIDLKGGVEFSRWESVFDTLAIEHRETQPLLEAANRVHDARMEWLRSISSNLWQPNVSEPALFIIVDELAELDEYSLTLVNRLARLGRASRIQLILATQRPTSEALGTVNVRTQLSTRICLRVQESADTNLILGAGSTHDGWRGERLGPPGSLLLRTTDSESRPRPGRAYHVQHPEPPEQPAGRLDALSVQAADNRSASRAFARVARAGTRELP